MYSRQHLKPSTSDRPGRSYTRLCGVSTTSAAMRQDFKTPRDLNQWTHESEGHMTRGGASEPLHPEQNTSVAQRSSVPNLYEGLYKLYRLRTIEGEVLETVRTDWVPKVGPI